MSRRRIPVLIVSGFLGSGKTTLLNHLLRHNGGVRIGVVVNDFGAVNIDAMLVAGQVDSMVSLGNGCICCAVDISDMDAMFDALAHRKSEIDVIVVEASGLAEPRNLIRMVRGSENEFIVYGGLVAVVDAVEYPRTRDVHPEIEQHLALADLVVLNKSDEVSETAREDVVAAVRSVIEDVPVLPVAFGAVDPALLFDRDTDDAVSVVGPVQLSLDELLREDGVDDHSRHLHARYAHTEFESDAPLDPRRLVRFLERPPGNLYRMKGVVHFTIAGKRRTLFVHSVGRHIRFESVPRKRGGGHRSSIVVIGTEFDAEEVRTRLRECVLGEGEVSDESSMMPVYRYLDTV